MLEYVPAAHDIQDDEVVASEVKEYFPASHDRHTDDREAPIVAEYVPMSHDRHSDDTEAPVATEYFPAIQGVQTVFDMVVHAVDILLPAAHIVQVAQDACPAVFLKVHPSTHPTQRALQTRYFWSILAPQYPTIPVATVPIPHAESLFPPSSPPFPIMPKLTPLLYITKP